MRARRIYLDHHATTPVDPRVLAAMLPWFSERFGNAASRTHAFGWEAADAVEAARAQVAAAVGAEPEALVFASGATESNNLALQGLVGAAEARPAHLVTCAIEHPSVLDPCRALAERGVEVTVLPVDRHGLVDPDAVARAIRPNTVGVSIMAANNEIGTLQPLAAIGAITRARGVPLHVDAAQALGRIPLDVDAMGIDLCALSAHKVYGPKGVGALFVRRRQPRVRLAPLLHGGGHERGLRPGTLPVPLIVGFGVACELAIAGLPAEAARLAGLRDRLWRGLTGALDAVHLNGHPERRLPGNLSCAFEFLHAEGLLMAVPELALSSGSACTSASVEPSHVLRAIGLPEDLAHASVRFGLGRDTTADEIEATIAALVPAVRRLRAESPHYAARSAAPAGAKG